MGDPTFRAFRFRWLLLEFSLVLLAGLLQRLSWGIRQRSWQRFLQKLSQRRWRHQQAIGS
jgi:hypothetical protein